MNGVVILQFRPLVIDLLSFPTYQVGMAITVLYEHLKYTSNAKPPVFNPVRQHHPTYTSIFADFGFSLMRDFDGGGILTGPI